MGKASRRKLNRPRGSARALAELANGCIGMVESQFPGIFSALDNVRAYTIGDIFWPEWCYLPMGAVAAYLDKYGGENEIIYSDQYSNENAEFLTYLPLVTPLLAWRQTKGIYRIDPELLQSLKETPINKLPVGVLYQMPEWALLLELEGIILFTSLEYDVKLNQPELRFLFITETGFAPFVIHLTQETLEEAIDASFKQAKQKAIENKNLFKERDLKEFLDANVNSKAQEFITPFVSVLLYICSQKADIVNPDNPTSRPSRKTKPSDNPNPRVWEVGYRIGTALKQARLNEAAQQGNRGAHQRPRAHIRRAHWHSFG